MNHNVTELQLATQPISTLSSRKYKERTEPMIIRKQLTLSLSLSLSITTMSVCPYVQQSNSYKKVGEQMCGRLFLPKWPGGLHMMQFCISILFPTPNAHN